MATLSQKRRASLARSPNKDQKETLKRSPDQAKKPAYMQTKMSVSKPGDAQEKQADRVAEQVSRAPKPKEGEQKAVNRASLEPAITPAKKDDKLSPKPVEAARAIQPNQAKPEEKSAARKASPAPQEQKLAREIKSEKPEQSLNRAQQEAPSPGQDAMAGQAVTPDVEARIEQRKGGGAPLSESVKADMENQIGHGFGAVNIHTDAEAADLCTQMNARAFTVGNDVYFAPGEYAPESSSGRELLAHELTHVVQQGGQVSPKLMRANGSSSTTQPPAQTPSTNKSTDPNKYDGDEGVFDKTSTPYSLELKGLDLPSIKKPFTPIPVTVRPSSEKRSGKQAQEWDKNVKDGAGLNASLTAKFGQAWQFGEGSQPIYYFQIGSNTSYLVGTKEKIRERLLRPYWTPEGKLMPFHVDHKQEYQLGGEDLDIKNLWLLDMTTNTSSGSLIDHEIERKVDLLTRKTPDSMWTGTKRPDYETLRSSHKIQITNPVTFNKKTAGDGAKTYSLEQIKDEAIHMGPVLPVSLAQVQQAGLDPNPSKFLIYNNSTGGRVFPFDIPPTGGATSVPLTHPKYQQFIPGFRPTTMNLTPDQPVVATLYGSLFSANPNLYGHGMDVAIPANKMESVPQAGYLNFSALQKTVVELFGKENIQLQGMSPLKAKEVNFDDLGGVTVRAQVMTDIELIRNADIELLITGNEVSLQKTFSSGELALKGPIKVTGSSLTVALSTQRGLAVEGQADLAIDKVGKGYIGAEASTGTGQGKSFSVAGRFNFDPNLFDEPSYVAVAYRDNVFSGDGKLAIGKGRIRGIRSGNLGVVFKGEEFTLSGSVSPEIPGVQEASIIVKQSEAEGLVYEGDLQLTANPAIRSGSIHATLKQLEGGWKISATGQAQPAIPGINSQLNVSYDDGAFTAEFSGAYQRGMLAGSATVGASNRAIGADGQPSGEAKPDSPLQVYGGGQASLKIAPWLQATAGIKFAPNGEVSVSGEIGIPSDIQLFPIKEINKNILSINFPIPIVPGIVAEIGGGLDAHASIGPGKLDQLKLHVDYNPAHEEDTHITGDVHVNVPAEAGLRLKARAGIGLGIPAASATGGLEVGGALGLKGAAETGAHVDWMPNKGLTIDAYGKLSAQPAFTFDVSGYVSVKALGFSVYDNTWQLASVQYGSNLTFGVKFPIHYEEGKPFEISLSDVEFQVPDVNPGEMVSGLISSMA